MVGRLSLYFMFIYVLGAARSRAATGPVGTRVTTGHGAALAVTCVPRVRTHVRTVYGPRVVVLLE